MIIIGFNSRRYCSLLKVGNDFSFYQTLLDYSGSIFDWFQKKAGKKDRCWFDKANNGSTSINAMNYHFD
jgi:hypothetical protein